MRNIFLFSCLAYNSECSSFCLRHIISDSEQMCRSFWFSSQSHLSCIAYNSKYSKIRLFLRHTNFQILNRCVGYFDFCLKETSSPQSGYTSVVGPLKNFHPSPSPLIPFPFMCIGSCYRLPHTDKKGINHFFIQTLFYLFCVKNVDGRCYQSLSLSRTYLKWIDNFIKDICHEILFN